MRLAFSDFSLPLVPIGFAAVLPAQPASTRDLEEAIKNHRKAGELYPKHARAYNDLGLALCKRNNPGDLEEAIKNYRKAVELDPKLVVAYDGLGLALYKRNNPGDLDEAIKNYRKGIELNPKNLSLIHISEPTRPY